MEVAEKVRQARVDHRKQSAWTAVFECSDCGFKWIITKIGGGAEEKCPVCGVKQLSDGYTKDGTDEIVAAAIEIIERREVAMRGDIDYRH